MRIAVVGAGAVGGYFGARLAASGCSVTFLARGRTLAALREHGLKVTSPQGDLALAEVDATDDPASAGPVDVVIVAVKAWQVPEVAPALAPCLHGETAVLPLQNGVEAPAQLAAALGREPVLGGLCKIVCQVTEPGHVHHLGAEPAVALGELDNRPTPRLARLTEALRRAGVTAENPPDIRAAMWEKFLFIAAVSGVGAVTRAPIGTVRELPETRALLEGALREIAAVAQAHGVALDDGVAERTLDFVDGLPAAATASMQRDVLEGRPSELEAQNGAVVRLGREAGVATPIHRFLYAALLPMEREARRGA